MRIESRSDSVMPLARRQMEHQVALVAGAEPEEKLVRIGRIERAEAVDAIFRIQQRPGVAQVGESDLAEGGELRARPDRDLGADDAERPDVRAGMDASPGLDDRGRMDSHLGPGPHWPSISMNFMLASATICPSTVARAKTSPVRALILIVSTSRRS